MLRKNDMKRLLTCMIVLFAIFLYGCASNLSGESYSREEARSPQQVKFGTVEYVRPVVIEGTKTPIGGAAGAAAEEGLTKRQGVEVTVRLEDGKIISVVQQAEPNETFAVGDKVRV